MCIRDCIHANIETFKFNTKDYEQVEELQIKTLNLAQEAGNRKPQISQTLGIQPGSASRRSLQTTP